MVRRAPLLPLRTERADHAADIAVDRLELAGGNDRGSVVIDVVELAAPGGRRLGLRVIDGPVGQRRGGTTRIDRALRADLGRLQFDGPVLGSAVHYETVNGSLDRTGVSTIAEIRLQRHRGGEVARRGVAGLRDDREQARGRERDTASSTASRACVSASAAATAPPSASSSGRRSRSWGTSRTTRSPTALSSRCTVATQRLCTGTPSRAGDVTRYLVGQGGDSRSTPLQSSRIRSALTSFPASRSTSCSVRYQMAVNHGQYADFSSSSTGGALLHMFSCVPFVFSHT